MAKESVKKVEKDEEKKVAKTAKASSSSKVKEKVSTTKKAATQKSDTSAKKSAASKKETVVKKKVSTKKEPASKKTSKKATPDKKEATKKKSNSKASTSKDKKITTKKASTTKKSGVNSRANTTAKEMLTEYYDLPYRYNETVVKILAQTPTTLFVYWDISDDDRNKLLNIHGENMFYETRPILIVHNTTKDYSFEVEINDFANSWYIRTQEPDCNYIIELGRRVIEKPEEYIYINSSNNMTSPNNHILFEKTDLGNVLFRNVKTNVLSSKDFGSLRFINDIDKLYGNLYDVYSRLYKDETLNELSLPSSGEFINK